MNGNNIIYFDSFNLYKIKNRAYEINLDEFKSIGTDWIVLHMNGNSIIYFGSFEVEYTPKEIKKNIGKKNIITNISRIQAYNSIMCAYFRFYVKR